jgi:hypothetical protein
MNKAFVFVGAGFSLRGIDIDYASKAQAEACAYKKFFLFNGG